MQSIRAQSGASRSVHAFDQSSKRRFKERWRGCGSDQLLLRHRVESPSTRQKHPEASRTPTGYQTPSEATRSARYNQKETTRINRRQS